MIGLRHSLNGHEFEQALGGVKNPWGHKQSDTIVTEQQQ